MKTQGFPLVVAVALTACDGSFSPYSEIEGPRLLAVRASPAAVAPGASTRVDALVVGADITTFQWRWCPVVGGPNNGFECVVDEESVSELFGDTPVSFDLGSEAFATFEHPVSGAAVDTICEGLTAVELPNLANTIDCTDGLPVQVVVEADLDGQQVIAIKEVVLLSSANSVLASNQNPVIDGIAIRGDDGQELIPMGGDTPPTFAVGETVELVAEIPDSSAEPVVAADGSTRERLIMSWFTTAGEFDPERETFVDGERGFDEARDVDWIAPPPGDAPEGQVDFFVVVRDDRGGVNWAEGSLSLEGAQ